MKSQKYRIEHDLLGEIKIPDNVYYGIQTQRAILNFPRNKQTAISNYPCLITALLKIKQAAAIANHRCGFISENKKNIILKSADIVIEKQMFNEFPVHRLHGGGGTSANMNANEVLTNIGNKLLKEISDELPLHPNDHINLNQSTNDVYPTACHIAIINEWQSLNSILIKLSKAIQSKSELFKDIARLSRTCLQDAIPITFKDFLSGYYELIERGRKRLSNDISCLYAVNLGGSIIGNEDSVPKEYLREIISALKEVTNDNAYFKSRNLFDSAQNPDDMISAAMSIDLLARGLIKIAKDIRLLSSGPEAGINEIKIPAVQPGSSAMPGKINPVIPEFVIQSCIQIIGNCHASKMAMDHGELDLNIWESLITFNILDSIDLMYHAVSAFITKCIDNLEVNIDVNRKNCQTNIAILSELVKKHGYKYISDICKEALDNKKDIKTMLFEKKLIN